MKNYEITVIIPSYNSEKWIERSLRSIYDQSIDKETYKVILIDDASHDHSVNLVERYFSDILILKNKDNLGLPASINKGIKAYSSQYVVRLDSDDFVDRQFLEYLSFAIKNNPEFDAVACDYYEVSVDGERLSRKNCLEHPIGCGIIFKRETLISLGLYDENLRAREEEDLIRRFLDGGKKLLRLPLPLYRYRKHPESITANGAMMSEYKDILDKKHKT